VKLKHRNFAKYFLRHGFHSRRLHKKERKNCSEGRPTTETGSWFQKCVARVASLYRFMVLHINECASSIFSQAGMGIYHPSFFEPNVVTKFLENPLSAGMNTDL